MTRQWLRTVLAAAAAVALLLPLPESVAADGTPAEAGNVLFTIPDGWQRSDQGNVTILTPPGIPAGKVAALRILPGEELTTSLRAWFDAHWETEKHGATVVDGNEVQAQRVAAGYDIVLTYGELQDKAGKRIYIFFLAAQAKTRVESYCFTTDSLEALQQNGAALTAFAQSLRFKNLQPASTAPVPAPAPAAPVTPPGPEPAVTLPPSISRQPPLWRSLLNLQSHRLSEEFDELMASSPVPLSTPPQSPLTLQQAIANARARLNRDASAAAIAGLRSSPTARSARSLQGAAMAAVVARKPAAALAALLIAYDKEPRNPSVLVNLAGLLARLGMPNEALALLDAADKLGASLPAPVGLKGQAVALNNRGYALLLLGRWKEADAALRKAVAQEPQLSEAARNLAYVLNQEGEKEEAKRFFLLGVWRVRPQTLVCGGATSKSGTPGALSDPFASSKTSTRPALAELVDLSGGRRGKLPTLRHPTDVREIRKFVAMTQRLRAEYLAWSNAASRRSGVVLEELNTRPSGSKSLTERRAHYLDRLLEPAEQPDVHVLWKRMSDAEKELTAESYKVNKSLQPAYDEAWAIATRPTQDTKKAHRVWCARAMEIGNEGIALITPAWNRYEEAERNYFALTHWYDTGIAALQGDPLWHEKAMLHVQFGANQAYNNLLANAEFAFHIAAGRGMVAAADMDRERSVEEPEALEDEDSPCCGGRKMPTVSMALSDALSVSVNCDSIGVEVGTPGWIGAFASAEYSFDGRVTVFAGPKAELGIEGVGTKAGMKHGLYITVDSKGIQDVGARVVFETTTQITPGVSMSTGSETMDFSFVPST